MWRFAAATGVTFFGAGAAFYASCLKAGVEPRKVGDLSALRAIGSTGSPLAADCYEWIWAQLPKVDGRDIWLTPISGGTDFAGAFVAGLKNAARDRRRDAVPLPRRGRWKPGASPKRATRRAAAAPSSTPVGELVCTKPMPSMPLYFWGDEPPGPQGRRYHDSYFDMYPGIWRHGDWIRITPRRRRRDLPAPQRRDHQPARHPHGHGRALPRRRGFARGARLARRRPRIPRPATAICRSSSCCATGSWLDADLERRLRDGIRTALSARHVPNEIFQVQSVPRTLSGKKMELPVKKLLLGTPAEQVFKSGAMADAGAIDWFVRLRAPAATRV